MRFYHFLIRINTTTRPILNIPTSIFLLIYLLYQYMTKKEVDNNNLLWYIILGDSTKGKEKNATLNGPSECYELNNFRFSKLF